MAYIIIPILIVVALLFANNKRKLRLKKEEEERLRIAQEKMRLKELAILHDRQRKELNPFLAKITEFNELFEKFKSQPKYISNFQIFNFKKETAHYYNEIKSKKYKHLPNFETSIKKINSFKYTYERIASILNSRNENFIESELKNTDSLLSDVEGKSLDTQQRTAVIIDEDNQLVIAGAGSGKTTTIAGKVSI